MKRLLLLMAVVAVAATSCQKDFVYNDNVKEKESVELTATRSYDEALKIAEDALSLLDGVETRSGKERVIKRAEGQTVMRPVTRGSETTEEPIMYVFNNENDEGFTVVAANRSQQPLIAVTEQGNYTYGEPTGVEPFDLLMEDVATSLSILPEDPFAIKEEIENERNYTTEFIGTQWGTGLVYGALYPDDVAFSETPAIAQAILNVSSDSVYTITDQSNPFYGIEIGLNKISMAQHYRYDHPNPIDNIDTTAVHNQVSMFYKEIGQRLIAGTNIPFTDKERAFSMSKIKSVLNSFGCTTNAVHSYNDVVIAPRYNSATDKYYNDSYIIQGTLSNADEMHNGKYIHTWLSPGVKVKKYEYVLYGLNKSYNPTHPDPYGYTELEREERENVMMYFNWGFDGRSNGWYNRGCFDMTQRITNSINLNEELGEYNYNYSDISYFRINQ